MVKTKVLPAKFSQIDVQFVRKRDHTRQNTKRTSIDHESIPYGTSLNTFTSNTQKFPQDVRGNTSVMDDSLFLAGRKTRNNQRSLSTRSNEPGLHTTIHRKNSDEERESIVPHPRKWARKFAIGSGKLPHKSILAVCAIYFSGCLAIAALILPNVVLYLMLPTLFQNPVNQSNSTETINYANHCGGVSPYTLWTVYLTYGITTYIDTRNCTFNSTPSYFTTILGYDLHDNIVSNNAIYGPTRIGFSIYIRPYTYWDSSSMHNYSQIYKWNVSWVGIY